MRFDLSEEQAMIRDGVAIAFGDAFAALRGSDLKRIAETARKAADQLAILNLASALVPTEHDGLGYGYVEAFVIAMECGRFCVPAPVKETLLVSRVLSLLGASSLLKGNDWFTLCLDTGRSLRVRRAGGELRLHGRLDAVPFGNGGWPLLVNAATEADADGGDALILVDIQAPGVVTLERASLDLSCDTRSLQFDGYCVPRKSVVAQGPKALGALRELELGGALLAASEAAGIARACLDMTVEYLNTRRTFGRLLGTNQVLRHRAADDFVAAESVRVAAQYASWMLDEDASAAGNAVSAAKILAGTHGVTVAENAIQSHGAIGFTWELPLHLFLRRALKLRAEFGSPCQHRHRLFDAVRDGLRTEDQTIR